MKQNNLYNDVVNHIKKCTHVFNANMWKTDISNLKYCYDLTTKMNPDTDLLDDYVYETNHMWIADGMPKEAMQFIWYYCGEKFLKSYVKQFVRNK